MKNNDLKFGTFFWRISSSHIITYFMMGLIASTLLDYKGAFENPPLSDLMKPIDSPWIIVGPVLQIFRGLIFSLALWFFRDNFIQRDYGWLKLWGLIVGLSILSTAGPTPGSIEGMIYTKIPISDQLIGYFEILPQTLFFSLIVYFWYNNPKKIWNILSIVLVSMITLLSVLGFIAMQLG
jgi:hypothetical protein